MKHILFDDHDAYDMRYYITCKELAKLAGVSTKTVNKRWHDQVIPEGFFIHHRRFWNVSEVETLVPLLQRPGSVEFESPTPTSYKEKLIKLGKIV